jgi:multisubunit Na+/H+ antiporter MnhG subunit
MRLIAAIDAKPTPWFWGINGAAGVLASITAVALSLALGINATLITGAVCYFLLTPVSLALLQPARMTEAKKSGKAAPPRRSAKTSPARSR